MSKQIIFLFTTILPLFASAQNITVSGYVKDAKSGEALIGATVFNTNQKTGTTSNNYGFYSLTLKPADTLGFIYSYMGYKAIAKKIATTTSIVVDVSMDENASSLSEVEIKAERNDNNVQRPQMGVIEVPMKQITTMPAIAGEKDVLKVIQLLPGVQSGHEGTTGFYVRGGNSDQNLVQLDEATVYNPNHLFGLFSSFNTNALNNVTLIKGGFPAQYGGRLSSILDITMKEGNKKNYVVSGGIGLITSNITVEGPIKKDKSSFIISARRSYFDVLIKPFIPKNKNRTSYYFYDVNAKFNYSISDKDRLFLSFFKGLDNANYTAANSLNYGINFGNDAATLRWNHLFSDKLFSNTSVIYNSYHNNLSTVQGQYYAQIYSGIRDVNAKTDLQFFPNPKNNILVGANYSYSTFFPATSSAKIPKSGAINSLKPDSIPQKFSTQLAFYASDEIKLSQKFSTNLGVRVPLFIKSTIQYNRVEPRLTLKYSITPAMSVKLSYTEMNQFIHLVPSSSASLPTDIWISSSKTVLPQISRQGAIGVFKNFKNNNFETSIEAYYKTMQHQVLFKEGTQPLLSNDIDQQLTFGKGLSYGIEFFVKKNFGKFTGWASYTLSWTTQKFDSLNRGKTFPFAYDKRHNISLVATYERNKKWTFAADWVFTSGGAFTLPLGRVTVFQDGTLYDGTYYDFVERNNYRYRAYHRLDVSAIHHNRIRKIFGHSYESEWVYSFYNIYSRRNPYFIYLTTDLITREPQAREVSLLPIVPSVSWNFKF